MENWRSRRRSNAKIDLTSLLDVIFILLFLVMQRNGGQVLQAEEVAAELQKDLQLQQEEMIALTDEAEAVRGLLRGYELLGDTATVISLRITPDNGDGRREIVLSWDVDGAEVIPLTWDTFQTGERRLRSKLTELMAPKEDTPVFISFQYDSGRIYRRDYEMVRDLLEALRSDRTDVYLKFTELN